MIGGAWEIKTASYSVQVLNGRRVDGYTGHRTQAPCPSWHDLTLHGKVDTPSEASLPWGVQDVQEKKSKTFHERV